MQEKKQHKSWTSGPGVHPRLPCVQVWGEGVPCEGLLTQHVPPYCLKGFQVLMSENQCLRQLVLVCIIPVSQESPGPSV